MTRSSANAEFFDAPLPAWADPVPPDLKRRPPDRHMRQWPRLNLLGVALVALSASLQETHACDFVWTYNPVVIDYPTYTSAFNTAVNTDGVNVAWTLYAEGDPCVSITDCGFSLGNNYVCIDVICTPTNSNPYFDFEFYDDGFNPPCYLSSGFYISFPNLVTCGSDTTPALLWNDASIGSFQLTCYQPIVYEFYQGWDSTSTTAGIKNYCGLHWYNAWNAPFYIDIQNRSFDPGQMFQMIIYTGLLSHVGTWHVIVEMYMANWCCGFAADSFQITLLHPCKVSVLTSPDDTAPKQVDWGVDFGWTFKGFSDSEATCYGDPDLCALAYSFKSSLPCEFIFEPINKYFNFLTTNPACKGQTVTITLTATSTTYPSDTPGELVFDVILSDPCVTSQPIWQPLTPVRNMQAILSLTTDVQTLDNQYDGWDQISQQFGIQELCGPLQYIVEGGTPAYMTITNGNTLTVSGSPAQAGVYSIALQAQLVDYPAVLSDPITISVVILADCPSTTLLFNPTISGFSIEALDGIGFAQFFAGATDSVATAAGDASLCGPRAYTILEGAPVTDFVSIIQGFDEFVDPFTLEVISSNLADVGTWTISIQVTLLNYPEVPAVTKVITNVVITHPCATATIYPLTFANPLIYQIVKGQLGPTTLTSFMQNTDSVGTMLADQTVCGVKKFVISPAYSQLTILTPDDPTTEPFALQISTDDYWLAGSYTIDLLVSFVNTNYLGTYTQTAIPITLLHPCKVTTINVVTQVSTPITHMFMVNGATLVPFIDFSDTVSAAYGIPNLCALTYSLSLAADATNSGVSIVTGTSNQISINPTNSALVGTSVTLTLSANAVPQQDAPSATSTFAINIVSPCTTATISFGSALMTMTNQVFGAAVTQSFSAATDSISTFFTTAQWCGAYVYTIVEGYAFLTIDPVGLKVSLQSNDQFAIGTYTATFKVELSAYPAVAPMQVTFQAVLTDPCLTTVLTLPTTLTTFTITTFDGIGFTQTFMPATDTAGTTAVVPGLCGPRVYSIIEAQPQNFMSIVAPAGDVYTLAWTLNALSNNISDVGTWTITLQVSLLNYPGIPAVTKVISGAIVKNPCEGAVITALTPTGDQTYVAGDTALSLSAPTFSTNSASCAATFIVALQPVVPLDYSAWANYDAATNVFTVQTADSLMSGTYQFMWVATYEYSPSTFMSGSDTFNVNIKPCAVTAVAFSGTLPTNIVVPAAVSPGLAVQLTGFSIVPQSCGAKLDHSVTQVNVTWPGTLTVTPDPITPGLLSFVSTSLLDVGTYTIEIQTTAALPAGVIFDAAFVPVVHQITFDVVSSCILMTLSSSPMTQVTYIIGDIPVTVPMPTYFGFPSGCILNLTYQLVLEESNPDPLFNLMASTTTVGSLPDFIAKVDPVLGIVIDGLNFSESWNTYVFRVIATDQSSLLISDNSYTLEVTTQMDCMSGLAFEMPLGFSTAVTYNIGSGVKLVNLEAHDSVSIAAGINKLCGPVVIQLRLTDETGVQLQPLPTYLTFDQAKAQLAISTADRTLAGIYHLKLEVHLGNFASDQSYVHRMEMLTLTLAADSPYQVPLPNADTASQTTNSTDINDALAKEIQELISQADKIGNVTNSTEFDKAEASANITEQIQELLEDLVGDQTDAATTAAVEAFAAEFRDIGGAFSAMLLKQMPPIDRPIQGYKITLRYADDVKISVNANGLISLEMSEPCVLVNNGERIDIDLLSLKFVQNSLEQFQMTNWELKTYTETKIELQLTFDQPLLVSQGEEMDYASITLSRLLFIPLNFPYIFEPTQKVKEQLPSVNMIFTLKGELPAQARSTAEYLSLASVSSKVDKASKATIAVPFLAQVAAKSSMKKLWFYFNTVQLADSFTEFNNVKPPANVQMLQKAYKDIINVKLLPDPVMDNIMENLGVKKANNIAANETTTAASDGKTEEPQELEEPVEPDTGHRNLEGLETEAKAINPAAEKKAKAIKRNQIIVAGIGATLIIAVILVCIFKKRIWLSLTSKRRAQIRGIYRSIFWNGVIRFMVEMYYPFVLGSLMHIYKTQDFNKNYKECFKLVVFVAFLLFTGYFMHKHEDEIDNRLFKARFGAYLTNCETYKKPKVIWYPTVFMARRFMMALCITFLKVNLVTQVLFAVHTSLLMLTWLIRVKPFDTKYKLYLELSNEAIVLTLSYFGYLFSDYVQNPVARYQFGYLYIGFLAFGLLFNIVTMGVATIADLVRWWRRRRHLKAVETNLKEKAKQQAEQQALQQLQLKTEIYARKQAFQNQFEKPG